MQKRSLFIARTPFQLFNCIEAQGRFDCGESSLLCIYKKDIDRKMMEKMLDVGKWKQVKWFRLSAFSRSFYPILLSKFLWHLRKVDYCFFGLTTKLITHCINIVQAKQNVLIDDGNEILMIAQKMSNVDVYSIPWYKNFFYFVAGRYIDYDYLRKIQIFTFFDLSSYALTNEVIKNDYRIFKSNVMRLPQTEEVFFIGSNLIGTYMNKEFFEENMLKIVNHYKDLKVRYVLHRYEDKDYLESLGDKLGFEVIQFTMILEMALLEYGKKPNCIATFRSTALETLEYLYAPIEMEIFEVDTERLLKPSQKDEFINLYSNYRNKNIPIVNLKGYIC